MSRFSSIVAVGTDTLLQRLQRLRLNARTIIRYLDRVTVLTYTGHDVDYSLPTMLFAGVFDCVFNQGLYGK